MGNIGDYTDRQIDQFREEMATVVPWVELLLDVPKSILGENGLPIEAKESFGILMDKLNKEFSLNKILDDYPHILDQLSI